MNIEILNSAIQDLHFTLALDPDKKPEPGEGQFSYSVANDDVKKAFGDDVVQAQLNVKYSEDNYTMDATIMAIVRLTGELTDIIERQANGKKVEDDENQMISDLNSSIIPALSAKARAYAALLSTESSNFAIMPADFDGAQGEDAEPAEDK